MAGPLPPGFTFDDEQAPAARTSVLPPGFTFDDEQPARAPAPAPADVPLPPRRPDDINALPDNPPPENPPLPPARPAEFPVGNDYSGTDFPTPPQQGGGWVPDKLNSLFGTDDPSRLTPEQGQTEHDAKVAAARDAYLKAKQEAEAARANIGAVNAANANPSGIPSFDSGAGSPPLSGEDLASLADDRHKAAADALVALTGQPNPTLTRGRAAAEAAINAAGKAGTSVAGLAGKVDRDLWGHPWLSEKVKSADEAIDSAFAGDPGRSDELGTRVAGAIGGMAPLLPIAAWSPAAAAAFSAATGASGGYDKTEVAQAEKRRPSVTLTDDEANNIARATAAKYPNASPEERKAQFTSAATSLFNRKQFDAEQNEATEGKQGVLGTNLVPQDYADIRSRVEKQNPKASEDQLGDLMFKEARALEHRKELTNRWLSAIGGGVIGAAQMAPFSRLLGRMEAIAPGSIVQTVKTAAEQGVHTSVEQVVVQGLSQVGDNGIHKLVADKDQSLIEGVAESAQIAAIVGAALGIGGAFAADPAARAALAERLRTSTPEEIDAFVNKTGTRTRGEEWRSEIDDFLRQKEAADAAKEAQSAPALPAPGAPESAAPPAPSAAEAPGDRRGESSGVVSPPEPPPTNTTQDRRQAEDAILRAMHYDDEDIADMSPGERTKRLKEAQQAGVTPEGAQKATPAADEALGTDSAPAESGTQEPKLPPGFKFDDEPAAAAPAKPTENITENITSAAEQPGESSSAPSAPSATVDLKGNEPTPETSATPATPTKATPPRQPQTLLSFLKAGGGIKDVGGNLRAAGLHRYPGLINNKSGMDPDRAREAAAEGGYLGADRDHAHSNTTPDDLLNELQKHPTYSSFDEEQLVQWRAHTGGKAQREKDLSKAESDIHADQLDAGAPSHLIDDHFVREGARLHVDEGVPLQDDYEQAVMRDVREHIGDDKAKELDAEIPWDNYEAPKNDAESADAKGAEGGHTTPAPGESTEVGGAPRSGGKDGNGREESQVPPARTGSPRDRNEERPLEEAGAEGKPQLVIPGAEQISQADLAKKKVKEQSAADLKPTAPQKDTDGLALFNDSSKQTDLLDQPAKTLDMNRLEKVRDLLKDAPEAEAFRKALELYKRDPAAGLKALDKSWQPILKQYPALADVITDEIEKATGEKPEEKPEPKDDRAALLATQYASTPAHKLEDGRGWRVKKERDGHIVLRMPNEKGKPPTHIRNDDGKPFATAEEAAQKALDLAREHAEAEKAVNEHNERIRKQREDAQKNNDEALGRKKIGVNDSGQTLYEDANGVRHYVDKKSGIRHTEPVAMRPTKGGVQPEIDKANRSPAFLTKEEERAKVDKLVEEQDAKQDAYHDKVDESVRPKTADARQKIEDAYLKATGGKYGEMVGLDRIRAALPQLDRATVDAALGKILGSEDETATLQRNDDPRRITPAQKEAAFSPAGEPFHTIAIRKPTAEPKDPLGAAPKAEEPKGKPLDETIADYDAQIDAIIKKINDGASPFDPSKGVPDAVADHLYRGNGFPTIMAARKFVKEHGGERLSQKATEEAIEHGVVKAARAIVAEGKTPEETYNRLVALYANQPKLSTRTSTSVEQQAYSTPAPLAYIASRLAHASEGWVLEPTAGNGMLLIEVDPKLQSTTTNELNPDRAAFLKEQGFKTTQFDASKRSQFSGGVADVVLANPPFGVVKENDKTKRFDLGEIQKGYETNEIDHAIALRALDAMRDNGRAVLILGGINKLVKGDEKRSDAYHGKAKREFFHVLYKNYNVTDHFTVAGELYEKQGAGWPVDVIAIHGRGKSARKVPSLDVPAVLHSWDELKEKLNVAQPVPAAPRPSDNRAPDVPAPASEPARPGAVDAEHSPDAGRGGPPAEQPADNGPGSVRDGRGGEKSGNAGAPGEPSEPPALRPDGERDAGRPGEPPATGGNAGLKPARQEQETEGQSAYRPQSKTGKNLGTLVPKNMRRATEEALEKVSKSKGSIDKLVASKLGMSHNEIGAYFAAEQVDALALALHNLEKGSGFIIGDQTGIGKGRVNAAIIRYALHNKITPIFVTEKPNLYADMYRDMVDTGMIEYLGREPKILATNSNLSLALDEDGKQVLKTPDAKAHGQTLLAAAHGLPDHDMVFTTYNQMQTVKGVPTVRTSALSALAPNSILILDESHNAGGTEGPVANDKMPRSVFIRSLVNNAKGVFYSSATYAKRPGVMDLYSKTDMRKAVERPEQLASAIASGGVPMQQVVAAMLAEAGQYIRRERSFAGVTYEAKTVAVDRKGYNNFSGAIAAIQHFSGIIKDAVRAIDDEVKGDASHISPDGSTGGAGANSTNFTAIMHNLVNQLLLAQKAEPAVRMAIEALKNGSKPVLTVANTMESFLQEYVADHDIKPNSPVALGFNDLLHRYLERTRTITIKKPFSKEKGKKHYLTDAQLGPAGVQRYKDAQAAIKKADLGSLPISPIDYMRDELARAGYKVAEITGRGSGISYADLKTPRYYIRPGKETSINGRRAAIKAFNGGDADAMILNQAGATGLSLHASEKVKDQRRRHMILVQPEGNIDTHMQMLGRVHRTGQVITPEYSQLVADIPAEKRPAAVLAKKMASLNASTTAARDGALTAENVTDFMNKYGDDVAFNIMAENPEINRMLGDPIEFGAEDREGAMRKLTGRIPLLPIERQEELYQTLESAYHNLLAEKEAAGENALEAKRLDLDARLVSSSIVKPGEGDSPFTQPVTLQVLDVKRQTKPYFAKDLIRDAAEAVGIEANEDHTKALAEIEAAGRKKSDSQTNAVLDAFRPYAKIMLGDIENEATRANTQAKLDDNEKRFIGLMQVATVGRQVYVVGDDARFTGIITKVYRDGDAINPIALGTWKVRVAIPGHAQVPFPFSRLYTFTKPTGRDDDSFYRIEAALPDSNALKNFDEMSKDAREQRVMLTGNLLAAYAWHQGRIVNYTDHEGAVRQGVLLSSSIESAEDAMHGKGTPLATGREVLDLAEKTREPLASSTDSNVAIRKERDGSLTISVPAAKAKGGDYFLDRQLRDIANADFVRSGPAMRLNVPRWGDQAGAIERLMQLGAKFEKPYEKTEKSASVAHMQRLHLAENHGGRLPDDVAKVVRDALDAAGIARSVAGKHADVDITERLIPISKSVAQKSGSDKAALAFGLFSSNKSLGLRLVQIAFATGVEKRTAYHEAFHALESADVFHDAEKSVLKRETPRLRQIVQKDLKVSDDELRGMPDYEIRAYSFEKWAHDTDKGDNPNTGHGLHLGIRRIFEKVLAFIRRLRNMLHGAGFQTTEDVFARARSGEMGQREAGPNAYNIRSNLGTEGTFTAAAVPHNGRFFNREPAIDKIKRKLANAVDPASAEESLLDLSARLRRMQVELAAGGHPVRPSTDAYMAKRLMPGKIEARKDDFEREYIKPLAAQMKADGLTLQDVDEFVASEHIPERNARMDQVDPNNNGRGSGFSDADAQAILARLSSQGKLPALRRAALRIADMREFELKTLEDSGLISQDQADALRGMYQHYVPFKGWEDPDNIPEGAIWGTGPGARMSVKGPEYHHAFGRTTTSDSPVANLINQTYRAITRAERNDSANTLYRLLKSLPKATRDTIATLDKGPKMKVLDESTGQMRWVTEPNWYKGDDVVSFKIAGNMHRMRFHDEALAQGINRLHPDQLPNWLRPVGAFINLEKSLWTHWNPDFVFRHFFMRYPLETFLNAREHGIGSMFATLKGYPGGTAFRAILAADKMTSAERATLAHKVASGNASEAEEWQHLYHRYRDAGGLMRFSDIAGVERIKKKLDAALARLDRNPLHAAMAGARAGYNAIDHLTNVLDNANRLAVFVDAVKKGATDKEAAFRAREASVDFALKGTAQKIINIWWPFGNTAAQTASRSIRGAKRSSAYRQAIFGMMALGAAQALYNYMVGGEDKDGTPFFEKIAPWTRRLNFVMMLPIKDNEGRPYRMTWSLPYFFAMPHMAGAAMMQLALKAMGVAKEPVGEILNNVMHSALEALTPMSQEDTLAGKFTPEPGRGILHAYLNQDFSGRSLYTNFPHAGLARSEQGKENTGSAWKGIASFANKATGGDRYHRGFADMYPEAWKEIFGGPTSAVERLTGHVASAIDDVAHGRAPNVNDIPVARTIISGDHSYDQADTARFYKERNAASAAEDAYKQARKNGDTAAADQMMKDNEAQIRSAARYRAASKQVNMLYKQLDRVKADDKMPAAEKDKEEQRIQKQQLEIMRRAEAR